MALSDALTEPRAPIRVQGPEPLGDLTIEDRPAIVERRYGWWSRFLSWISMGESTSRGKRTRWVPYDL